MERNKPSTAIRISERSKLGSPTSNRPKTAKAILGSPAGGQRERKDAILGSPSTEEVKQAKKKAILGRVSRKKDGG